MMTYIEQDGAPTPAASRLGITPDDVTGLLTLQTQWNAAYAAYRAPDTHNAITVEAMKIADNNMFTVVLPLRQRVKNGAAELSAEDYAQLTIHKDKTTRTPSQVPREEPVPVFIAAAPLNLTFEATLQTAEGVNRRALPEGYRVARMLAIVPMGAEPPAEGDYHSIDTVGSARFTLTFTTAEINSQAYIRIAYENTAGRGPFSHSVKNTING
ncbi:MAG: hypothetical protein ACR2P4_00945 [Gammaproteobacteria bacterium]